MKEWYDTKKLPNIACRDGGYAPRFFELFLALGFPVSSMNPPSYPPAGNASR